MKVLILGGTGLISTGVVGQLRDRGFDVFAFSRRQRETTPIENVVYLAGDRNSLPDLTGTLRFGPFDTVIDMICFRPEQAQMAIDVFTGQVGQYIFCSTVDVYSKDSRPFPVDESAVRNPRRSFSYAYGKFQCEELFEAGEKHGAFALTTMRPAATYLDRAIAPVGSYQLYIERLREGLPIVIHGDGSSLWVSAHRDDVAEAFVNAVGNSVTFSRAYNLAGTELLTWNDYWKSVANALGVPDPKLVHVPTDFLEALAPDSSMWCVENFQYNNIFDVTAAQEDLRFQPTTTWAQGCAKLTFQFDSGVSREIRSGLEDVLSVWTGAMSYVQKARDKRFS